MPRRWLPAARALTREARRNSLYFLASVLTIAIVIAANVAVFSVVESVLIRPLPYEESSRLTFVPRHVRSNGVRSGSMLVNGRDVGDLRTLIDIFDGVEANRGGVDAVFGSDDGRIHVRVEWVTPELFELLGVSPIIGPGFAIESGAAEASMSSGGLVDGEDRTLGARRMVLSFDFWQSAFGGDPEVVGQIGTLDGEATLIGGVMPRGFDIPRFRSSLLDSPDLWVPFDQDLARMDRGTGTGNLVPMARLKDGVTVEEAAAAVQAFSARLQEEVPSYAERGTHFGVYPLKDALVDSVRPQLTSVMGAVGLLLLLACGNVACLLLARGSQRRHDTAIMLALGCPRRRLIGSRLSEAVGIALVGGALGLALGWAGAAILERARPPGLPSMIHVAMSWRILAYALATTTLATLLFGVYPAVHASRALPAAGLRKGGVGGAVGGSGRPMRMMVVFETAVSVTLLFGAFLLIRTAIGIGQERPGFDIDATLALELRLGSTHPDPEERAAMLRAVRARLAAIPGVDAVGAVNILPFSGGIWNGGVAWDAESAQNMDQQVAAYRVTTPGYFDALGTDFVAGRDFVDAEDRLSVIIDETLAETAWPGEDPIGRTLMVRNGPDFSVVGVVEPVRRRRLQEDDFFGFYVPYVFNAPEHMGFVLHTSLPPASLGDVARRAVIEVDPRLTPYGIAPLGDAVRRSVATTRYVVTLMIIFAGLGMTLAAVGLYGVMAYSVRLRVAELGLRKALGATSSRIFSRVLLEALALVTVGVLFGALGAYALGGVVESILFGVSPVDVPTYALAITVLFATAAIAGGVPAWRASVIDPVETMKGQ